MSGIRDFDAFDLRFRLPAVVSKLHKAVTRNGGVAYIHCTAGLGRAPATAVCDLYTILLILIDFMKFQTLNMRSAIILLYDCNIVPAESIGGLHVLDSGLHTRRSTRITFGSHYLSLFVVTSFICEIILCMIRVV